MEEDKDPLAPEMRDWANRAEAELETLRKEQAAAQADAHPPSTGLAAAQPSQQEPQALQQGAG
eukprot:1717449-Alexandrium_andersonii.AAC.1